VLVDLSICDPLFFNFKHVDVEDGTEAVVVEYLEGVFDGVGDGPGLTTPEDCVKCRGSIYCHCCFEINIRVSEEGSQGTEVSEKASMRKRKRIGATTSPCLTPLPYGMLWVSLPILSLRTKSSCMESFDKIYGIFRGTIYFKKFIQTIMICCIEAFTKVYEKCPGTQIVVPP
jgi:hypothetical protein